MSHSFPLLPLLEIDANSTKNRLALNMSVVYLTRLSLLNWR